MILSPHFTLQEAMASHKASELGIDNTPPADVIPRLKYVALTVLEPVRTHYGVPLVYDGGNSWYRCERLNKAVHGVWNSQHVKGEAVDIEVPGISNVELAHWIKDNLKVDEIGLENWNGRDPHSGWVHVAASEGFLGVTDVWTYDGSRPKNFRYSPGLPKIC